MSLRSQGRSASQPRPLKITPKFLKNPMGSVLVEYGETRVLCTASVEDSVPNWMRGTRGQGWVTAEYSLLPASTHDRTRRERQHLSGRTQEIQRLIGRSLRSIVDMKLLGERTIIVDCDVLQADGGTRTAAITGGYVALKLAIEALIKQNKIKTNPLRDAVAAVSVGILEEQVYVDLDYHEDQKADVDLNVVMTASGQLLEVQGTAEKRPFNREQLNKMLDLASDALKEAFDEQNAAFA
ncbi:ribonuclease PH [Fluviispira multicolorata]|uniref:Ribonuclease PH n=1 Tax=Fluviispira multicolorata TaxID=2654512 RepID=A0A833JBB4_9BACT|nr:ribonuclease PH [Fluviispira multicolorata]KAB8029119.1 ribonuclease PH [Fluviispira multicolorata]